VLLTNEFDVAAPLPRVWELFDDIPAVIPCMPGASFLGKEGDDWKVGIKVKVGIITANFQGVVRFVERDLAAHKVVLHGSGKDTTGKGAANANIETTLSATQGGHTHVSVKTDLSLSGRIAQFGSSVIADIASRLVTQFTENLHRAVLADETTQPEGATPAAAAATTAAPPAGVRPEGDRTAVARQPEALDLGAAMAPIIGRYVLKYVVWAAIFALGFAAGHYLWP